MRRGSMWRHPGRIAAFFYFLEARATRWRRGPGPRSKRVGSTAAPPPRVPPAPPPRRTGVRPGYRFLPAVVCPAGGGAYDGKRPAHAAGRPAAGGRARRHIKQGVTDEVGIPEGTVE